MLSSNDKMVLAKSLVGSTVYSVTVFIAIELFLWINNTSISEEFLPIVSIMFIMSFVLVFNTMHHSYKFESDLKSESMFLDVTLNDYRNLYPFNVALEMISFNGEIEEENDIMHEMSKINPSMLNYVIETVLTSYHKDMFTDHFSRGISYKDLADEYDTDEKYVEEDIMDSLSTLMNPNISQYYTTTTNVLANVEVSVNEKLRKENSELKKQIEEMKNSNEG